jgi:hypothetical protein
MGQPWTHLQEVPRRCCNALLLAWPQGMQSLLCRHPAFDLDKDQAMAALADQVDFTNPRPNPASQHAVALEPQPE